MTILGFQVVLLDEQGKDMPDETTFPIRYNVNHYVRVRLTDAGRVQARACGEGDKPEIDGWSEWQMHTLMLVFGPHMSMGRTLMFETEIELIGDPWPRRVIRKAS